MFKNREEAGKLLAEKISKEEKPAKDKTLILGIPRGGVIIAKEIGRKLDLPIDVIVVKKLAAPEESELAIGAVAEESKTAYLNDNLAKELDCDENYLDQEIKIKTLEVKRRARIYRQGREFPVVENKTIIVCDDGTATGATAIAGLRAVWSHKPKKVILALPVLPDDTLRVLEKEADEVISLARPSPFFSVGQFYEEFPQVSDEEVIRILQENKPL